MNTDDFILYRRIYRMRKQKFKPTAIAAALSIPIATVYKVLKQFNQHGEAGHGKSSEKSGQEAAYMVPMERPDYLVLDLGGQFVVRHIKSLREEFQKIADAPDQRLVALRLAEVQTADSSGIGLLMNFHAQMQKKNRPVVLLDPSKSMDALLRQLSIYSTLPVFGTELALQEKLKDLMPKADPRRARMKF